MRIDIAKDFSDTPGGRTIDEGEYSGELFRRDYLIPKYTEAVNAGEKLEIVFDGAYGYPPSFLDEAFGGLVRELKKKGCLNNIVIIANDNLSLERRIKQYVSDAEKKL